MKHAYVKHFALHVQCFLIVRHLQCTTHVKQSALHMHIILALKADNTLLGALLMVNFRFTRDLE